MLAWRNGQFRGVIVPDFAYSLAVEDDFIEAYQVRISGVSNDFKRSHLFAAGDVFKSIVADDVDGGFFVHMDWVVGVDFGFGFVSTYFKVTAH
jgi:hypothetical protein